jgi:hypothetical protein
MSDHTFLRFSFFLLVDGFGNIRLSGANGEDIFPVSRFHVSQVLIPAKPAFNSADIFPSPTFLLLESTVGKCGRGNNVGVKVAVGRRIRKVSTGDPFTTVGSNCHRRAASTAASRNSGCPLMAVALMTRPVTEMVIRTSTFPEALNLLAFCGYFGCGLKIGAP